jgi:hypothetical protein
MGRTIGIEVEGFTSLRRDSLAATLREHTGIEVYSAGWRRASTSNDVWTITTDGSIKHPETKEKGKELVSPPLEFDEKSYEQLRAILKALRSSKILGKGNIFRIDKQCSVHVHVSREGLDKHDLFKVYSVYATIENELHKMFPESRRNNKGRGGESFCAPISNLPFEEAFEERARRDLKYYAVQFPDAIPTIEFRIHGASVNARKIWNWVTIINEIIDFALQLPVVEVWDDSVASKLTVKNILSDDMYDFYLDRVAKLAVN